jgi:hypothetical protein
MRLPINTRSAFFGLGLAALLLAGAACREQPPPPPPQPEYAPTATIKDLMVSIVDPSADVVWDAVATIVTPEGIEERRPQNDDDWAETRRGAITLVEATNLLMIPGRHVARPGERSEAPGVELEPADMDKLIAKDPAGWIARAKALHDASLKSLQAIDAKDPDTLFEVGEQIEHACENCHVNYWYPGQRLPPGYRLGSPR